MIIYEKINNREITDHYRPAKERKSPMTIHLKFLAIFILGMAPHIASAQYHCGGGIIQSIRNNWNNEPQKFSIVTDNSIPSSHGRFLFDGSVVIDFSNSPATRPYDDILETVKAAFTAGSYVVFYQTNSTLNCTHIDSVQVCKSIGC